MTGQVVLQPESDIAAPVPPVIHLSKSERLALLKTKAEFADPMQSAIINGWFLGDLRAPK